MDIKSSVRPSSLARMFRLRNLYLGVLISAAEFGVRLRPKRRPGELFNEHARVREEVASGALEDPIRCCSYNRKYG